MVGGDKSRGDGGSAYGGGSGVRAIADQRKNLMRFMMHRKLVVIRAELAAKKTASNRGRGRGGRPWPPPPRRLGWSS